MVVVAGDKIKPHKKLLCREQETKNKSGQQQQQQQGVGKCSSRQKVLRAKPKQAQTCTDMSPKFVQKEKKKTFKIHSGNGRQKRLNSVALALSLSLAHLGALSRLGRSLTRALSRSWFAECAITHSKVDSAARLGV